MRNSSRSFRGRLASALGLLTVCLCAGQAPSLSGTWHVNVAKSKWGTVSKPVSVVLEIEHKDKDIHYHGAVTYANEDTREFGFTGAFDGKPYRMSRSYGEGSITMRRVDSFTFESTFRSDDGQYTEDARTTLSGDLKTLTRRLTLRSPEGTKSWTEVYEKK